MSAYIHEGLTKVSWVVTLSSISSPTAVQLNAGTDISTFITKDGLNISLTQNNVANTSLSETFDSQLVGSWAGDPSITFKRNNASDTAWDLFEWGAVGFLAIRRGIAYGTTWTAAQKAEIYPAQAHEPVPNNTAANAQATATVKFAITSQPDLHAVVA